MSLLLQTIKDNRAGRSAGVYSVCCAHALVIEAALEQAKDDNSIAVIEATANQVNQFGGYTGKKPDDFRKFVSEIARKVEFDLAAIVLGGDHLGPVCWANEPAEAALKKSEDLIAAYVRAGFKKIHLDCSMPCLDDAILLDDKIVAERAARLCGIAEKVAIESFGNSNILYIIGTEVPPPGGTNEEEPELTVTSPAHARRTMSLHHRAFIKAGLESAWPRVIGLVVQPGVEFSHTSVIQYDRKKAAALRELLPTIENIVFEAHSTDYQLPGNYLDLVDDHFAILKVGPQLTFALREALFALSHIEDVIVPEHKCSHMRAVCEKTMVEKPVYWQKFYPVPDAELSLYRQFSYSDRIRYYWPDPSLKEAAEKLFSNLSAHPIPLPLISQYLPDLYWSVADGSVTNAAEDLVKARIKQIIKSYSRACFNR